MPMELGAATLCNLSKLILKRIENEVYTKKRPKLLTFLAKNVPLRSKKFTKI